MKTDKEKLQDFADLEKDLCDEQKSCTELSNYNKNNYWVDRATVYEEIIKAIQNILQS